MCNTLEPVCCCKCAPQLQEAILVERLEFAAPADPGADETSAADMANAGARKELEGFSDAFKARDELKRSEAEARAKKQR
jgi:hypothetical protein